ncbi:MAG: PorV/PorQ family protein [Candidatus Krumholzibacteriia bacterium]|nr:PorV/PorQ family protein [bacterium]MCB9514939.1 PorV/PorQ family protein [Candidatus Latescibacterota bacterium]
MNRTGSHAPVALLTLLLLLLASGNALASVAGAASLQIPPSARFNGLGQSGVALADDATAAWWNPAGLGFMTGRTLGLMHSKLVPDLADDIYYEFAGWVQQLEGWGTYSVNVIYLSYGTSVKTTDSPDPEGTFTSYEFSPSLSYGVRLDENTAVGLGFKYVRVDLAPSGSVPDQGAGSGAGAGGSVAVDLGFLRHFGNYSAGLALTNFGPNISFIDAEQSDPLPRFLRLGAAGLVYQGEYGHVLVSGDFNKLLVSGGQTTLNGGTELQYTDIMALRIGYMYDPDGHIEDFTFGGGFHKALGGKDFFFDYANIPQADNLDRVHRFSFEMLF